MSNIRQVIIGNSAAGLSALEAIRRVDNDCPITIISEEDLPAYSRVLLPYYIAGKIEEHQVFIRDERYYADLSAKRVFGKAVTRVEPGANRIILDDGSKIEYDNLLIATGASPSPLKIRGTDCKGVFSLRTLKDSKQILPYLEKARESLLIGAGLISFHLINAFYDKKGGFILLESTNQVLPQMLDPDAASIMENEMKKSGIAILKGRTAEEINQKDDLRKRIVLSSGEKLEADLVIVAIGVNPNIDFLRGSGISSNRGILVDRRMRTNYENIFAAGDVAEAEDFLTHQKVCRANWTDAVEQGRIAGYNMAGVNWEYTGSLSMNITEILGIAVVSIGLIDATGDGYESFIYSDPPSRIYRKIIVQKDRIVGSILLGKVSDAGIMSSLVKRKEKVANWKQAIVRDPLNFGKIVLSLWKR